MGLWNYAEQILNIYNYYNGAIMINRQGCIEYYYNNRQDINTIKEKDVLGKTLFETYPGLTADNSTMFEVIRTGKPILNKYQTLQNYKGETYGAMCNTFPIMDHSKIVGAVEIFLYLEERDKHLHIFVTSTEGRRQSKNYMINDIISKSSKMDVLKERIIKVSHTASSVLIYGETGTGKELVAQAIHANGERKDKRFISQNCAAIPENLLESILFGTVRGSFTDAENRMGLFEAANGGTLFLDEINSMDLAVQAKILKAIEEQKIVRIGGVEEIPIDVRIITATNANPKECMEDGRIREDLYYRLKVVQLSIPPLRERKEDIKPLVNHYVEFFNKTMNKEIDGVSDAVMRFFADYHWPGNVRELRNMIESGFNLCEGEIIDSEDIDIRVLSDIKAITMQEQERMVSGRSLKEKSKSFERYIIQQAIIKSDNLTKAAERLGISRQTLNNKMKELKLSCKN